MVKAGALGDAHVKSWDRTWSNPGFEKARRVGLVLKLRPLVTVAGVSQILVGPPLHPEGDGSLCTGVVLSKAT